jgi:hypothetical protein
MKIPQSLRLSLREMFLLVALIATGLGWHLDHQRLLPQLMQWHEFRFKVQNYWSDRRPHIFTTEVRALDGRTYLINVETLGPLNLDK